MTEARTYALSLFSPQVHKCLVTCGHTYVKTMYVPVGHRCVHLCAHPFQICLLWVFMYVGSKAYTNKHAPHDRMRTGPHQRTGLPHVCAQAHTSAQSCLTYAHRPTPANTPASLMRASVSAHRRASQRATHSIQQRRVCQGAKHDTSKDESMKEHNIVREIEDPAFKRPFTIGGRWDVCNVPYTMVRYNFSSKGHHKTGRGQGQHLVCRDRDESPPVGASLHPIQPSCAGQYSIYAKYRKCFGFTYMVLENEAH